MPPPKKSIRDRLNRLNRRLPSPKKAIKHVAAIMLSPVKARPQKKHRSEDPEHNDSTTSKQEPWPGTANSENVDVFWEDTNPAAEYQNIFHQGSMLESPTAAPMAFNLVGKFTAHNTGCHSPHDDDHTSIHTFPTPHVPSMLAEEEDDNDDLDSEIIPPEFDELCAPDAGVFGGDGYPRPAPPKTFVEKMAALGTKQFLAVAPDITSDKVHRARTSRPKLR
ncbi:hypothetical protein B0H10DRAFT_1958015 [Mycena sp. CBHHK59/15]|nr:hypothetical protein B0H10DRAFT_1958015 [Mycena sp. CBHHK59/15]